MSQHLTLINTFMAHLIKDKPDDIMAYYGVGSVISLVVMTLLCVPELEMLSWAWKPVCGLIGSIHCCIWKIKLWCSTEKWSEPRDVGWRPREDKHWVAQNKR